MKNSKQKTFLITFLFLLNSCGNSVIHPPKPKAVIDPLVGLAIAGAAIAPLIEVQYSTCDGADAVKIGDTKTASLESNTMKFYKLTNASDTDYVAASFTVSSGSSSSSSSSSAACMYVGKEDKLIDTNSSTSTLDYPSSTALSSSSSSCSSVYSFVITQNKFRCIGIATFSKIDISFKVTQTTSSATPTVSSISPTSGPIGTLVTITGTSLGSSSSTASVPSVKFGSSTSSTVESQKYSELKVRVPKGATTGSVTLSYTNIGSFTVNPTTMMTKTTPACTFTSINGSGTTISQASFYSDPTSTSPTNNIDNGSTKIPIGFSFTYFGASFDNIYINTNGGATFLPTSLSSYLNLQYSMDPTFALAPWWDDLKLDSSSSIQYSVAGTTGSRVFTVEWVNYPDSSAIIYYRLNFQIKLYEGTNLVDFNYGSKTPGSGSGNYASIGIKNGVGGSGNFMDGVSGSTTTATLYNSGAMIPNFPANTCYRFTP